MRDGIAQVVQNLTSDHVLVAKALRPPVGTRGANGSPYFSLTDLVKRWPPTTARRAVIMATDGIDHYGFNRQGAKTSQGLIDSFWLQGMQAGHKAVYDCIKAFSETDQTEDLKKFDVPTLILHGDDDQIVPIKASALLSSKLVKGATLKVIPGAPHGMVSTLKDQINAELLAFFKSSEGAAA
jgi:pimeloyl-ACP methyl ester carboxylesterase